MPALHRKRRDLRTLGRYLRKVLREFRWTLVALVVIIAVGGILYRVTPQSALGGERPSWFVSFYGSWMSLYAQPIFSPPDGWYLELLAGIYPLFGVVLIGEGIVRFALLMVSRRRGEKEWMLVMASTYRQHVVLCGLGHLGFRVLNQLLEQGREVVAIEKDPQGRFVEAAKATGVPVLIRDVKDDDALVEAGVAEAQSIIVATDDDMANLEVALDARRMNPRIRTAVRLFDQATASKVKDAFGFDFAFSAAALAAPTVAAMSLACDVVAAFNVGTVPHVVAAVTVRGGSRYDGASIGELEADARLRVLYSATATESPPAADAKVTAGETLVVHAAVDQMVRVLPRFSATAARS
jgi:Trk K+ transport system NAD-binding subunit